jgi:hypothetical protein
VAAAGAAAGGRRRLPRAAFAAGASSLRLLEARLVKYNASAGQTELGILHRDG